MSGFGAYHCRIVDDLIADDDGWIFRKARYYRGAVQEEDERKAARELLVALAGGSFGGRRIGSLRFWTVGGCLASALALLGLVEGRFPGVFRPDPFLLDPERRALSDEATVVPPPAFHVRRLSALDGLKPFA